MMRHAPCSSKKSHALAIDVLMASVITFILFANPMSLRVNISAGMSQGVYLLRVKSRVNVGDLIMVCLGNVWAQLARKHRYLSAGNCANDTQSLLKQLAGKNNDPIERLTRKASTFGKDIAPELYRLMR